MLVMGELVVTHWGTNRSNPMNRWKGSFESLISWLACWESTTPPPSTFADLWVASEWANKTLLHGFIAHYDKITLWRYLDYTKSKLLLAWFLSSGVSMNVDRRQSTGCVGGLARCATASFSCSVQWLKIHVPCKAPHGADLLLCQQIISKFIYSLLAMDYSFLVCFYLWFIE